MSQNLQCDAQMSKELPRKSGSTLYPFTWRVRTAALHTALGRDKTTSLGFVKLWDFFILWLLGTLRDKELIDNFNFPFRLKSQSKWVGIFQSFKTRHPTPVISSNPFGFPLVSFFWFFFPLGERKARTRGIGQTSPATQWRGFQIRRTWRTSYGREGSHTRHPGEKTRKSVLVLQTAAGSQEWLCEAQRTAAGSSPVRGKRPSVAHSCQSCLTPAMSPPWRSLLRTWGLQGGCWANGLIGDTWKLFGVWSEQETAWGLRCWTGNRHFCSCGLSPLAAKTLGTPQSLWQSF